MTDSPLDIIIPIWNSPIEVRAALASFAADSPMGRLIMVNNGSERETESILHEFAEALDERALLFSAERNIGTVAALNLGLSKSTAPFVLLTNPFVRLASGWFDSIPSLFERIAALGAVCLRSDSTEVCEADCGSLNAMVLHRKLLQQLPAFDEQLDGAVWTLRDFCRKATAMGFRTAASPCRQLKVIPFQELGSLSRRQLREQDAREIYTSRWGEPVTYLLHCGNTIPGDNVDEFREILLQSARHGDRITLTSAGKPGKLLIAEGFATLHENIDLVVLPRLFADRAVRRTLDKLVATDPAALIVSADDMPPTQLQRLSFTEFVTRVGQHGQRCYRGGKHA